MKTLHTFFLLFAFVLAKAQTPTITFNDVTKTYGDAPFYMTASSNSVGAFAYSVLNTAIASIDQFGYLTIKKGGSTTITVTQAASAPYLATSKTAKLTVNKASVFAVNITSANTVYANDSLSLSATSNFADAKYTFSIKSQSGTNATIKGTKLYAGSNTGTLDITGDVVADENFNAGTVSSTITQTITIQASSGTPEIIMENKTVSFGTAPFNMAATSNSPAVISYSIDSGSVATITPNGLVTILGVGVVKIKASQMTIGGFLSTSKTTILTINKAVVSSFTITSSNTVEINDSISLTAISNPPGAAFKWSLVSQNRTSSTITGSKLYAGTAIGSLEIKAEVLADANFFGSTASNTGNQTISITNANYQIPNLVFSDQTIQYSNEDYYLYANSNSYGARTFSLLSGTAATVTSDGKLTKLGLGTVMVQVTQAAYPPYKTASKTATITIEKSKPSVYFVELETYLPYIDDTTRLANANDTISFRTYVYYGNPKLEFSIINQNGTNAILTGNKLYTGTDTGTVTLMLKAVGDNFNYESIFKRTIIIGTPQVSKMAFKDTTMVYGQSGFRLLANSNNPYGIEYSVISGNAATVYQYGEVLTKGAGSVIVKATQKAYPPFAAISKTAVLTIQKATPVITITSRDDVKWNDSLLLTATTNPTNAKIKWSILSQNGTNSSIVGNKLFAGSQRGTLKIKAIVEGDSNFYPASSEIMLVGVDSIIKSIITVNNSYNNGLYSTYGAAPFYVTATSNSSGAFSYSVANDSIVMISPAGLVTIIKPGMAMITISQAATPTFKSTTKSIALQIYKAVPSIKITSANTINISDSLNLTATSTPAGAKIKWTVSVQSGTNSTIIGSKLYAGDSVGFLDIRAEVVPDDYFAYGYVGTSTNGYSSSDYKTISVYSTSGTPTIYFPNSANNYVCSNCDAGIYKMKATSNSLGAFTYSILDEPSASINSEGIITFKNLDSLRILSGYNYDKAKLTVQVSQEAYPPYNSASKTAIFRFQPIITELENSKEILSKPIAYPNPAKDLLQIRSGKGAGCEANISLYNMNGEVQNAISTRNGDDYQLDISELSSGVYSLKMTYCNEVFTQKVVKQ